MKRPIIGIIGKVQPQYGEDIWHRIDEVDEIRYLIVKKKKWWNSDNVIANRNNFKV